MSGLTRTFALIATLGCLAACSGAESLADPEYEAIMRAVLAAQSDVAAQREAWLKVTPNERTLIGEWLDHRPCVDRETGRIGLGYYVDAGPSNALALASAIVGGDPYFPANWASAGPPKEMGADWLPQHLRWDSAHSICPSGVIQFGNPVIVGDLARVFARNGSSTHGWEGFVHLQRTASGWQVRKFSIHLQV